MEVEALWNLLIFMVFRDVAAWSVAGWAQTERAVPSHFSVLVLGVVLLSSGSCKSLTLDLVSALFSFFLEFGSVNWTAAPGTGAGSGSTFITRNWFCSTKIWQVQVGF